MWVLILSISFMVIGTVVVWYVYFGQYIADYKKARIEIVAFVNSYKGRCTGQNRFVVTKATLQDSFREYDIKTIEKVWLELIDKRIIEKDLNDDEWCIR